MPPRCGGCNAENLLGQNVDRRGRGAMAAATRSTVPVFPKRGRAALDHAAPLAADQVNRLGAEFGSEEGVYAVGGRGRRWRSDLAPARGHRFQNDVARDLIVRFGCRTSRMDKGVGK